MNNYIPQVHNETIQVLQKERMHPVIEVELNLHFIVCSLFALTAECSGKECIVAHSRPRSQNTRKNEKNIFHLCSNVTQQAFSGDWTKPSHPHCKTRSRWYIFLPGIQSSLHVLTQFECLNRKETFEPDPVL